MKRTIRLAMGGLCMGSLLLLQGCGDKAPPADAAKDSATATATSSSNTAAAPASAAVHPGKALHDANCISCHDSGVYTRSTRKVQDYMQLAAQVQRCDANLGTRLFDEDLAQITEYLNQAYYQYPK